MQRLVSTALWLVAGSRDHDDAVLGDCLGYRRQWRAGGHDGGALAPTLTALRPPPRDIAVSMADLVSTAAADALRK